MFSKTYQGRGKGQPGENRPISATPVRVREQLATIGNDSFLPAGGLVHGLPAGCRPIRVSCPTARDESWREGLDTYLKKEFLTAYFRRLSQIRIRHFTAETQSTLREEIFAQSGDDDWAKTYISNLSNVFVCRRLPTNKKLILCALCASAVIFLKGFHSVAICVCQRLKS